MLGNSIRSLIFWKFFSKNLIIGLSLLMLFSAAIAVDSHQLLNRGPKLADAQEYEYFGSEEYPADYQSSYEPTQSEYQYYDDTESSNYVADYDTSYDSGGESEYQYTSSQSYDTPYGSSYEGSKYEYVSSTPYDSSYNSDYSSYSSSSDYQYYGSQPYDNYASASSYDSSTDYGYDYVSSTPYDSSSSSDYNYGYDYVGSTPYDNYGNSTYDSSTNYGYEYVSSTPYNDSSTSTNYGYDYVSSTPYPSTPTYTNYETTTSTPSGSWQYAYPECDWSSGQVYDVYWHSGTGEYDRRNYHYQDGSCGYNRNVSSTQSSGTWEFKYPECDWNSGQVYDVYQHTGTGAYERRNPHYQEDACGRDREWEGPGCDGNRSVWGVWDNSSRNRLLRVERDYGVVPGECNNPYPAATQYPVATTVRPTATPVPQVTTNDRQECYGRNLVMTRYYSDNRSPVIITDYGERVGYCGVQAQAPVTYSAPQQTVYSAPAPAAPAVVSAPTQPGSLIYQTSMPQIQAVCTVNTDQIVRGQSVTYRASISTGGTGRVGRADFRGERSQSSASPTFTVPYTTSGVKYMTVTVYDADSRGGSQLVECPWVSVYEPTVMGVSAPPVVQPTYVPPTAQQPVVVQSINVPPTYTQPTYYQQPSYPAPQPASPPTTVYAQQPVASGSPQFAPTIDYCPQGKQLRIVGNTVYCEVYMPNSTTPQTIGYTYSDQGVVATQPSPGSGGYVAPPGTAPSTSTGSQCPAGYVPQTSGSTVYCVAQQAGATAPPSTVVPTQQQPQVTYKTVDNVGELPKTGVPLVAWGVASLLPAGLIARKRRKMVEGTPSESSANSIWISREINKETFSNK